MRVPPSIQTALQQAVKQGVFPGAVLAVRCKQGPICIASAGRLAVDPPGPPVVPSTTYDLASLTKPLATVTAVALLMQEGRCRLDDRADQLLPELQGAPIGSATLRDLLTHSSGLPGWRSYYERLSAGADLPNSPLARADAGRQVLQLIQRETLVYVRGTKSLYSDLGFMLLGFVVERVSESPLDRFLADRIARPLGAEPLQYLPTDKGIEPPKILLEDAIAPTEYDPWRGRLLRGEVHDQNAAALGGVAGHAGLFGTAESVLAVTGAWLKAFHRQASFLHVDTVQEFTRRQDVPGSSWALGWDTPSTPSSSGQYFSPSSFGHLGYTGTSIWTDPTCDLEVVLLSNRVHPSSKNDAIRSFRPAIHNLVYEEFAAGCSNA